MTTSPLLERRKTVTRRFGWWHLKPGDIVQPVRKAMGLRKGETVQKLGYPIRIVSVRKEPLNAITQEDVIKEGFHPSVTPEMFVEVLCTHYKCKPDALVNRIEFEYTGGASHES